MKKNIKKYPNLILFSLICFFVFCPVLVNGGLYTPEPKYDVLATKSSILARMNTIIGYVYNFLFIVATIFFLISLYGYLTAGGDTTKIKKVTHQLFYAVLAIIGGLFSYAITKIIESILG